MTIAPLPYLLDTNILLRLLDRASVSHAVALAAVSRLLAAGHELYITAQNLIEFWAVATRPVGVNGLGWDVAHTRSVVSDLMDRFPLLDETPDILARWLRLVSVEGVSGRQVHDARIVAVMETHGVTHLLTFNAEDFRRYSAITVVHPETVR